MSKSFKVSHSKEQTYQRCKAAYNFKYGEKLAPKRKGRPLMFGNIVHQMIEASENDGDPFKVLAKFAREHAKTLRIHREEYGELIEDVDCIMTEYFEHYANDHLVYIPIKGRNAEHEFEVEIDDGIVLTGKIDALVRTPNKSRWLAEHKTFSKLPSENQRWRNVQSPLYTRVAEMLGWPSFDGVMWDYIWSKSPGRPQLLKSGKLAKRSINTLPSRVIETLKAYKLRPEPYRHLITSATKNRSQYFQRIFTPTKKRVVDMVFNDFLATAREMRDAHGKAKGRTIGRHCDWCEFEPICRAELTGGDVDFIKENQYEPRKKPVAFKPAK